MKKIIVICPGGAATGGVELLHQLVDSLILHGCDAAICYYPFFKKFQIPPQYQKYKCPVVEYSIAKKKSSNIILPEVFSYLSNNFESNKVYIWWMSVDNYKKSGSWKFAIKNYFLPWRYKSINNKVFGKKFDGHFYQSEYAKDFLEKHIVNNIWYLSDYLNLEYLSRGKEINYSLKENLVVYNPAKGITQTNAILPLLKDVQVVPIVGMKRDAVMNLLERAKVYIDFGNHPGKDRIPREAAILGCCVLTNLRGSASNSIDIPISDFYKVDDYKDSFEVEAAEKIISILTNFNNHIINFDNYRKIIEKDKLLFEKSIESILPILNA